MSHSLVHLLLLTSVLALSSSVSFLTIPRGAMSYHNMTVQVAMRDGVLLNTILCIPDAASATTRVGSVIMRTPYGAEAAWSTAAGYAEMGWVGVVQDARGRFASGGNWSFWRTAAADGEDTFAWLAAQPWSNGKFASVGGECSPPPRPVANEGPLPTCDRIAL